MSERGSVAVHDPSAIGKGACKERTGNEPSVEEARVLHAKARFTPYRGAKIKGPRYEIGQGEAHYPEALLALEYPPKKLYVIGDPTSLKEGLAIVGARKATPYGLSCTRLFASHAASRDIVVISGGALGCDSAAHRAALDEGGRTVVFLGGGCDELYPAKNASLFQEVVDKGGALVSEQSWNFPPLRHTFRARNRLIAGLAKATLIAEAGLPSGTFSTADEALAANKDVLVVPGAICSPISKGTNRLLYQGATPVVDHETFDDVLVAVFGLLHQQTAVEGSHKTTKDMHPLLAALYAQPLHVDEMLPVLRRKEGAVPALESIMVLLSEFQQQGLITRYPDGRYGPARV